MSDIKGLYFNRRKDKTIKQVLDTDEKYRRKTVTEEHVSIISEAGLDCFSYVTPADGSSKSTTSAIPLSLHQNTVDHDKIVAVGCDETAVNSGNMSGVIRKLEESLGGPLQWLVCMLHVNELPLR